MSTTLSQRTSLTSRIKTNLEGIRKDNEHRTEIGSNVMIGEQRINAGDVPCCVITPGDETLAEDAGLNGHVQIQYIVSGWVNRLDTVVDQYDNAPQAEYAIIDAVIKDIREIMEGSCDLADVADTFIYQGAQPNFHEEGGELCGAELRYLITTPYVDFIPGQ